jgi:hypothetical protein
MPALHTASRALGLANLHTFAPGAFTPVLRTFFKRTNRIAAGGGSISGDVLEITTPKPNTIVRLYDRETGLLVREVLTDGAGLYSFTELDTRRRYYALALDDQPGGYNAAIADYVQP